MVNDLLNSANNLPPYKILNNFLERCCATIVESFVCFLPANFYMEYGNRNWQVRSSKAYHLSIALYDIEE